MGVDDALQRIRTSLEGARARTRRFRRLNSTAILVSIILGAVAAFLAGAAAIKAERISRDAKGQLVYADSMTVFGESYSTVCGAAAILSLLATISSGLQKGLDLPGQEGRARSCMARLLTLELAASANRQSREQVEDEYGRVVGEYPELFA
jgi:uncharacterized membrane protein YidH (DUF202 family)